MCIICRPLIQPCLGIPMTTINCLICSIKFYDHQRDPFLYELLDCNWQRILLILSILPCLALWFAWEADNNFALSIVNWPLFSCATLPQLRHSSFYKLPSLAVHNMQINSCSSSPAFPLARGSFGACLHWIQQEKRSLLSGCHCWLMTYC